jgi:isocitrate dehydrogenase (NAD+)
VTLDSIRRKTLVLKDPLTTPIGCCCCILSDEIAGLIGGLGMAPGANIGAHPAIFEAVHGSAPDIAGKGLANPLAVLLAAALMLDHVGLAEQAARLRGAIDAALNQDKVRTRDLGGTAGTREFAAAVIRRIGEAAGS